LKHKAQHALWAKLGNPTKTAQAAENKRPLPNARSKITLKVIEMPGFRELEDKFIIYSGPKGQFPYGVEDRAEQLSIDTFGIKASDTELKTPPDYWDWPEISAERNAFDEARERHDEQFETLYLSDDEAMDYLLGLGVDFRNELGNPLKCISLFAVQAEAAAKGIAGKLPEQSALELKRWESRVELEVKAYLAKKKR